VHDSAVRAAGAVPRLIFSIKGRAPLCFFFLAFRACRTKFMNEQDDFCQG